MSTMEKPAKIFLIISLILSAVCLIAGIVIATGGGDTVDLRISGTDISYKIEDKQGETVVIALEMPTSGRYNIHTDGLFWFSFCDDEGEKVGYSLEDSMWYAYEDCLSAYLYKGETYYFTVKPTRNDAKIYVSK